MSEVHLIGGDSSNSEMLIQCQPQRLERGHETIVYARGTDTETGKHCAPFFVGSSRRRYLLWNGIGVRTPDIRFLVWVFLRNNSVETQVKY